MFEKNARIHPSGVFLKHATCGDAADDRSFVHPFFSSFFFFFFFLELLFEPGRS